MKNELLRPGVLTVIALCLSLFVPINAQVATPVFDDKHNATTAAEGAAKNVSMLIQKVVTSPVFEKISKVQKFLKDAVQVVSGVIANLKMTRQLVEAEGDILKVYNRCITKIAGAEGLPGKWVYTETLTNLFYEHLLVFEVFDLATQENMGIMDDRGRVELIKKVLQKTRRIRLAMKTTLRRANQSIYKNRRAKKEWETFTGLFKDNR